MGQAANRSRRKKYGICLDIGKSTYPNSFNTKLPYHFDENYGEDNVYGYGSHNRVQYQPVGSKRAWKIPAAKHRPPKHPGYQRLDIRDDCTDCQSRKMQFSESWLKHPDKGDMKRGKRHKFILSIVLFLSIRIFVKQGLPWSIR